ncbi:hypothetical protein CC2G_013044 [Coprinopsis cinerea AmutBmut pab1-1]|nr:hypothetical protein CC2G_013044 [Coprinopsis cinerea AmutBmut pab1-1]
MDNLAHDYPLNHRKRKADNDDCSEPQVPLRPDQAKAPSPPVSATLNAPRQPCLASESDQSLWPSSSTPASSPLSTERLSHATKRPRLDRLRISGRKTSRRSPKSSPTKSPAVRHGSDLEDIGIVPTADPGPSSGSLLRSRTASFCDDSPVQQPWLRSVPFDLNSLPIPPPQPLINRQTLKELDLDAILRNPQLRHDLLFDPGLQFRPTGSRRKREMADKYWTAIVQEVEHGCTCMTFEARRKPHRLICICGESSTSSGTILQQVGPDLYTVHIPPRVPSLLTEFLEVLLLVIQPLSSISGIYVNPNTFKAQMQEHSAQAAYIRSLFDPALIEQELRRNLFDPSGLFRTIGETLKGHCAPMRDRSVEAMIRVAEQCGSGPKKSARDAIKAIRMCMEILELMKLDIANHQLQTLRPFLLRTSGQFELRTLKGRCGIGASLNTTREWIEASHSAMLQSQPIFHPLFPGKSLRYDTLSGNQQLYISVLRGIVDLVFDPPAACPPQTSTPTNTPPATPTASSASTPCPNFPETLYLDNARMHILSSDASDTTALYMFLLLFRQLVFSDNSNSNRGPPKLTDADLIRIKREIRDIAGNFRPGRCFSRNPDKNGKEAETWRVVKEDVVLQVAKRATDARTGRLSHSSSPTCLSSLLASSVSTPSTSTIGDGPDERSLSIARKWADTHIRSGSPLSTMLHNRLKDVVFNAVVTTAFPARDLANGCRPVVLDFAPPGGSNPEGAVGTATGMEPLADEIRTLAEKISLLASIHLNAYLPMYENEGFAPSH